MGGAHTLIASLYWSDACDTTVVAMRDSTAQGRDNALVNAVKGFVAKTPASPALTLGLHETTAALGLSGAARERFALDVWGETLTSGGLEKKKQTTVLDRRRRRVCRDESASPRMPLSVSSTVIHGTRPAAVSNERFLEHMRADIRNGRARISCSIDCMSELQTCTHDAMVILGTGNAVDTPLINTIICSNDITGSSGSWCLKIVCSNCASF